MKDIFFNIFVIIIGILAFYFIFNDEVINATLSAFILMSLIAYKYSSYMYALYKKADECEHNQRGPGGMCTLCMTPKSKQRNVFKS